MAFGGTGKRNLLILGRTGVGKSTVANHIVGRTVLPVSSSLESVTRKTRKLEEVFIDNERKVEYKIKIIDTVGLQNQVLKGKDIMEDIKDYSKREVPEGIHLILFTIRNDIFLEEEKEAFDCVVDNFKNEIKDISALVITGCEKLNENGRKKVIQRVQKDLKSFVEFMGKDIYPVGFPCVDDLQEVLKKIYEEGIKVDADKLRDVVKRSDFPRMILRIDESNETLTQQIYETSL